MAKTSKIIINMSSVKYTFNVLAMSSDKVPVNVTGLFTIAPCKDIPGFSKYKSFVSDTTHEPCKCTYVHLPCSRVEKLVMNVIKSEICVSAALKTMEEINGGAKKFIQEVSVQVELELDQFGLKVYNVDFKQVKEVPWYSVRLGWRRPLKLMFSKSKSVTKQTK